MAAREAVCLNESTPQLEVPQSGDTYEMPRDVNITGDLTVTGSAPGGAFEADAQTQITPSTAIVLDEATGNEIALDLQYTTNKATSGNDTGLLINQTDTASPGTSLLADFQKDGVSKASVASGGSINSRGLTVASGGVIACNSISSTGSSITLQLNNLGTAQAISGTRVDGASNLSSGHYSSFEISPAYIQTGTGSGTDLLINRAVTSVGSGEQLLIDAQVDSLKQLSVVTDGTILSYGSYTDASNYERLEVHGDGTIQTAAAGTGTNQGVKMSQLTLDPDQTLGPTTGLWFGDGNTGIYEVVDNIMVFRTLGTDRFKVQGNAFFGNATYSAALLSEACSNTNPTVNPNKNFAATGIGGSIAGDQQSFIVNSIEGQRITESGGAIVNDLTGVATLITGHTIAGLPTPALGMIARITDGDAALAWGATAVNSGAGATPYLVWYNGTNWTILGS